jgi:hypothetical protein
VFAKKALYCLSHASSLKNEFLKREQSLSYFWDAIKLTNYRNIRREGEEMGQKKLLEEIMT